MQRFSFEQVLQRDEGVDFTLKKGLSPDIQAQMCRAIAGLIGSVAGRLGLRTTQDHVDHVTTVIWCRLKRTKFPSEQSLVSYIIASAKGELRKSDGAISTSVLTLDEARDSLDPELRHRDVIESLVASERTAILNAAIQRLPAGYQQAIDDYMHGTKRNSSRDYSRRYRAFEALRRALPTDFID